ncbi:MAG: hypothetical protein Q4G16_02700 [Cruoricaptor ignavus]|nr:hypothetical protein [Cruoricaptor ignavus]
MKKAIVLAVLFFLVSCNRDDGNQITSVESVAVDSVTVPRDTMQVFATQTIVTYSKYIENCEGFYDYDYRIDDLQRNITPYKYKTNATCGSEFSGASQLIFSPQSSGTYVLKFWAGNDSWLEKTVVVQD